MANAKTNRAIETMEIGPEMDHSTIRIESGELKESSLVILPLQVGTSHRSFHTLNQDLITLVILCFVDHIIDRLVAPHLMDKISHTVATKIRRSWSVSAQQMITQTSCLIFSP